MLDNLNMKERLKNLRIESGLTQQQLAEKLGTTNKNIWAYENGVSPPIEILIAYADFFGVTTDYILCLTDEFSISTQGEVNKPQKITKDELQLLYDYRNLNTKYKKIVIDTIKTLKNNA